MNNATSKTPISMLGYVIVDCINKGKVNYGYELTKVLQYLGCERSHQQIYRELKKVSDTGLLDISIEEVEGKPDRKRYTVVGNLDDYYVPADQIQPEFLETIGRMDMTQAAINFIDKQIARMLKTANRSKYDLQIEHTFNFKRLNFKLDYLLGLLNTQRLELESQNSN